MLAFIHVAKTGGQTIETMLANSFGAAFSSPPVPVRKLDEELGKDGFVVPKFQPDDLRRLMRMCPWTRCVGGHPVALWSGFELVTPTTWFSMVREPMARGASHFQYNLNDKSGIPREWDDWVLWPVHHNHQVKMFSPEGTAEDAIRRIQDQNVFVGLTERFDESLVILRNLVSRGLNISYRRTNTASDNSRAKEVLADPAKVEEMKAMYKEDIKLYAFIAEEWYPKFVKKYGPDLPADVERFQNCREKNFSKVRYFLSRLNHHLILKPALNPK